MPNEIATQPIREEWQKKVDEIYDLLHLFERSKTLGFDLSEAVWVRLKQTVDSLDSLSSQGSEKSPTSSPECCDPA